MPSGPSLSGSPRAANAGSGRKSTWVERHRCWRTTAWRLAVDLERSAERLADRAREANQNGDNYVLMTILFATVLVFAGLSSKMDSTRPRLALIGMATTILVVAAVIVATFPRKV